MDFTGHSLSGGLASSAAATTGMPANTFNAAGLNRSTVGGFPPNGSNVDAWHTTSDPLSGAQNATVMPQGYGTPHTLPFVPPPNSTWFQRNLDVLGFHGMNGVIRSLDQVAKDAGCGG